MVSLSVDAEAGIDFATKDDIRRGFSALGRRLHSKDRSIRRSLQVAGQMPTAGPLLLDFGGPPTGTMWAPLIVGIVGSDDHTAVANGVWAVYAGGEAVLTPVPMLGNLLIPGNVTGATDKIPGYVQPSGKEDVYLHYGDSLFVLVYGAAAATNLLAYAKVREIVPSNEEELNIL